MATNNQTVYFGSDLEGHELKKLFKEFLQERAIKFVDLGIFENDDAAFAIVKREVGEKLTEQEGQLGVLIYGKKNIV
jgi:ribose 5-phosphate isomerase RpiB